MMTTTTLASAPALAPALAPAPAASANAIAASVDDSYRPVSPAYGWSKSEAMASRNVCGNEACHAECRMLSKHSEDYRKRLAKQNDDYWKGRFKRKRSKERNERNERNESLAKRFRDFTEYVRSSTSDTVIEDFELEFLEGEDIHS